MFGMCSFITDNNVCCVFNHILGMECDAFDNPADFFLDKLNEAENDLQPPDPESKYLHPIVSFTNINYWNLFK